MDMVAVAVMKDVDIWHFLSDLHQRVRRITPHIEAALLHHLRQYGLNGHPSACHTLACSPAAIL